MGDTTSCWRQADSDTLRRANPTAAAAVLYRKLQTQMSIVAIKVPTQHSISHNPVTDSTGNRFSSMFASVQFREGANVRLATGGLTHHRSHNR